MASVLFCLTLLCYCDVMSLPPDRSHIATEQRHESDAIDRLSSDRLTDALLIDQLDAVKAATAAGPSMTAFVDELLPRVQAGGRLFYLGAGTSGRLGVLDASECPPTFNSDPSTVIGIIAGGDSALRRSSEAREDDSTGAHGELESQAVGPDDTVLGIAAGGTTPWVLGGVREASRRGAMTGLMTCAALPDSAHADHHIHLETGAELVTGSTRLKAGTATKIALNTITTSLFVRLGKVYEGLMVDLKATNSKLHDRCLRILCELCPGMDRAAADDLLQQSDGQLKVAILMARSGIDGVEASRLLSLHEGDLAKAIR